MQFWADVLLEKPENAQLLPSSASPIIWGYEPSHPFPEQAKAISSCNLPFCLAPGTGTWRSFSGRLPNALANIDAAILNAKEYNAEGILLTSWGDCGNHQPWVTLYPPLLYGAAQSWNDDKICESSLITGLNKHVFQKQSSSLSKLLIELGKLDQLIGSDIANTSLCWSLLFAPLPNKLIEHLRENHRISQLDLGLSHLQKLNELVYSQEQNDKNFLLAQEISLGIELSTVALQKEFVFFPTRFGDPYLRKTHYSQIINLYGSSGLDPAA